MWWILWVSVALIIAAVMFGNSQEAQKMGESVLGIKPASLASGSTQGPPGLISTKMGMRYVMTTEDVFIDAAGERQSPNIVLTCSYGAPYLMVEPKVGLKKVMDAQGREVAGLRVSMDNKPAVTAVADFDEAGNAYVRGAQSAAGALAKAANMTLYLDTESGLQNANFEIAPARRALSLLAAGCKSKTSDK